MRPVLNLCCNAHAEHATVQLPEHSHQLRHTQQAACRIRAVTTNYGDRPAALPLIHCIAISLEQQLAAAAQQPCIQIVPADVVQVLIEICQLMMQPPRMRVQEPRTQALPAAATAAAADARCYAEAACCAAGWHLLPAAFRPGLTQQQLKRRLVAALPAECRKLRVVQAQHEGLRLPVCDALRNAFACWVGLARIEARLAVVVAQQLQRLLLRVGLHLGSSSTGGGGVRGEGYS